ncbi:low temperature requirement protein A [Mitsuaria sp. TWR114]|uniref:low temperature requirement protein A n=1 Tax=Mitsuaria sp. TWR114 TaxID=2601731 RepID=UPI002107B9B9|nr:low temperature requirement protein A [Mitsuaria sp. TWR114]
MSRIPLLRRPDPHGHAKVSFVELFFDLVFVFAVTQLSHTLIGHFAHDGVTLRGAAQTGFLMLAVWWVWIFTSWVTNWLDPERLPVRLCLFAMMLAGLLMSVSLPQAFGERALMFALSFTALQVGRTLFFLWAARGATWPWYATSSASAHGCRCLPRCGSPARCMRTCGCRCGSWPWGSR